MCVCVGVCVGVYVCGGGSLLMFPSCCNLKAHTLQAHPEISEKALSFLPYATILVGRRLEGKVKVSVEDFEQ